MCAICLNVLKQPMQCTRNEHFFCQPCITRHLAQTQRCPTCIEPLTIQTLRPARFVKDLISQLNIRCDNADRGCVEMVKLEMLEGHVANCEFSAVQCSNDGCEVIINRRDQLNHEMNDCNFRQGKCEVCGKNVAYRKRMLHCYVTRNEVDEMKDEMKDEMSSMKEIVMNMSKEFTRHMGDIKDQMVGMKDQMGDIKDQMGDMKDQMCDMKEQMGVQMDNMGKGLNNLKSENWNVRDDIIIAGGDGLKSVETFSWSTREWTFFPQMTSERWLSSSFLHEGQMFVCGGFGSDMIETLELKGEGGEWKKFQGKLPQQTFGHANTIYKENLFIFGGQSSGKVVDDIYKVDLVSPYSSQLVSYLPEPQSDHGAQRFGDKVAIVGGTTTGDCSGSVDSVVLYDIKRNCCRTLAPLPFAVCRMATVALGDYIIIIGGEDKNDNELNTVVSYNITNETSKMLPSMKHKRSNCSAVVTGNVIVVMGGRNKESKDLNSVEMFSFDNYSWEELPPMNEKREGATAVVKMFCK